MLGGTLEVGEWFQVARNGNGTFTQAGGTMQVKRVHAEGGVFIASNTGSHGLYEISGGSLTVDATNAGIVNGNSVDQEAGGTFGIFRVVGSDATITVGTNYTQANDARYEVVIDENGVSPMTVGGNVNLFGGVGASFTSTPTVGQQFPIMNYAGGINGTFTDFDNLADSPLGPNTVQLSLDYGTGGTNSIVLTVDALLATHPGDFDGDGDVDGADFVAWQTSFPFTPGSSIAPVAEPSTLLLGTLAAALAVAIHRRSRRINA
jgi:hypothetical protein